MTLRATSATGTVNCPACCPASTSLRARGAKPRSASRSIQASASDEPGNFKMCPAEQYRKPQRKREHFGRVGDAGAGFVDHLPQRSGTPVDAVSNTCSLLSK